MPVTSVPFLKLSPIREEVKSAIEDVINSGLFMNGRYLNRFKSSFSNYLSQNYIIPTANCTDALEIILRSINITEEDEVITSAFSWFSNASVIQLTGAKIVFCDIDLDHFAILLSELKKKITVKTKAIILPHLFGLVHPDIHEIKAICQKNKIVLIEDCAQAHGSSKDGKLAGTFGDISAFSFYPTKNLGALGDAGAILTNQKELSDKCYRWANHGQKDRNIHSQLGRNSRMDEIQAAVICANLKFLDQDNLKRQSFAKIYFQYLTSLNLTLPANVEGHVYHQFVVRTDKREKMQQYLLENGIETDIHYPTALSDMTLFNPKGTFSNASQASKTVLSLPIHPNHSEEEITYVAKKVRAFFTS